MNYKLEKFWNKLETNLTLKYIMNYKLEKFWNSSKQNWFSKNSNMNYKLEKFWNERKFYKKLVDSEWTINLKSFEIMENNLYMLKMK